MQVKVTRKNINDSELAKALKDSHGNVQVPDKVQVPDPPQEQIKVGDEVCRKDGNCFGSGFKQAMTGEVENLATVDLMGTVCLYAYVFGDFYPINKLKLYQPEDNEKSELISHQLSNIPTCDLISELTKREGVEEKSVTMVGRYNIMTSNEDCGRRRTEQVDGEGPARILVVID